MEKKVAQVDLVARVDGLEELGGAIEEVTGHLNAALELMRGLEDGYAVHVELVTVPRPAGGTTSRNYGHMRDLARIFGVPMEGLDSDGKEGRDGPFK